MKHILQFWAFAEKPESLAPVKEAIVPIFANAEAEEILVMDEPGGGALFSGRWNLAGTGEMLHCWSEVQSTMRGGDFPGVGAEMRIHQCRGGDCRDETYREWEMPPHA